MRLSDLFFDILYTLWAHKVRTALTMFGIIWGIVSITLMVAAGEGLRVGQKQQMETLGKDLMIVFNGRTSMQAGGVRAGRSLRWKDTDHISIREQAPACECVLPEQGRGLTARSQFNSASVLVDGSLPEFAEIRSIQVAEGRFCNYEDEEQSRRVAFLGSELKKQLFGARSALGETIYLDDIPYQVIGLMRPKEQDSSYDGQDVNKIFIPFRRIVDDFPERPPSARRVIDRFLVTPKSLQLHETCKQQVRTALARIHNFDPRDEEAVPIWDTVENAKAFRQMTDGMKYFLGAVGFVTLFVGGIGVMNVMLVAVREQTREIGVRRAIGATSRSILWQYLIQTFIIVFLSGGLGMGMAFGLCALVNLLPMPPFFAGLLPTWETSLLAFALLGLVAILAAIYPARRAATIDPIEALRYEPGS
ncbi:MAG: ABC transporter permease [Acidobacteriota bacterium]